MVKMKEPVRIEPKKVIRLEDGAVFETLRDAAEAVGCDVVRLYEACKMEGVVLAGSAWAYLGEDGAPAPAKEKAPKGGEKKVRCIETGKVYRSMICAANDAGGSVSGIMRSCRDHKRKSGGLTWEFVDSLSGKAYL